MNIVAEFQFTLEEIKEGMEALGKAQLKTPSSRRQTYIWLTLVGLAAVLMLVSRWLPRPAAAPGQAPAAAPEETWRDWVPTFVPWFAILVFVWFFLFYRVRKGYVKKMWDSQPALHRLRMIRIDDEGISMSDSVSQNRMLWSGYTRFVESEHLFLLFLSGQQAELIPKRVFADEEQIGQVRQLLAANISAPQSGFPVLPVGKDEFTG